jgi:hypothetical protein
MNTHASLINAQKNLNNNNNNINPNDSSNKNNTNLEQKNNPSYLFQSQNLINNQFSSSNHNNISNNNLSFQTTANNRTNNLNLNFNNSNTNNINNQNLNTHNRNMHNIDNNIDNNIINPQNSNIIKNKNEINIKEKMYECPKCHEKISKNLMHSHLINHRRDGNQPREIRLPQQSQAEIIQRVLARYFNPNNYNHRNHPVKLRRVIITPNLVILQGKISAYDDLNRGNSVIFPEIAIKDPNKLDEENKKCMICLENFSSNERVTALPCIHLFHTHCIEKWMGNKQECPVCKLKLTQSNIMRRVNNIENNY